MGAGKGEQRVCAGFGARQAGDGEDGLDALFRTDDPASGNPADLGDTRPGGEVLDKAFGRFEAADLDAAVALIGGFGDVQIGWRRPWFRGGNRAGRPGRCRCAKWAGCL